MNMVIGIYSVVAQHLQIIDLALFVSGYLKIVADKKIAEILDMPIGQIWQI